MDHSFTSCIPTKASLVADVPQTVLLGLFDSAPQSGSRCWVLIAAKSNHIRDGCFGCTQASNNTQRQWFESAATPSQKDAGTPNDRQQHEGRHCSPQSNGDSVCCPPLCSIRHRPFKTMVFRRFSCTQHCCRNTCGYDHLMRWNDGLGVFGLVGTVCVHDIAVFIFDRLGRLVSESGNSRSKSVTCFLELQESFADVDHRDDHRHRDGQIANDAR